MDHKVSSEVSESRLQHGYAVVVQDFFSYWIQSHATIEKSADDTKKILQRFSPQSQPLGIIYTDISLEIMSACEDHSWDHNKSIPPHWSESNGMAQSAVRRVKEVSASVLVQFGARQWNVKLEK